MSRQYTHLSFEQRMKIQLLKEQGVNVQQIAKDVGCSRQTIYNELKRNASPTYGKYTATQAQKRAEERKKVPRKKLKIENHPEMERTIIQLLTQFRWSPEIIAKELEKKNKERVVSAECIYQYIYRQWKKKEGVDYTDYLRVSRKKRQKRACIRKRRGSIKDRIFIDQRPPEVQTRARIGDWEIDLIEGKNKQSYLLVMVERASRYVHLQRLRSKNALHCTHTLITTLQPFAHIGWVKTMTFDNGKEFAAHSIIAQQLRVNTYFTHPYSA